MYVLLVCVCVLMYVCVCVCGMLCVLYCVCVFFCGVGFPWLRFLHSCGCWSIELSTRIWAECWVRLAVGGSEITLCESVCEKWEFVSMRYWHSLNSNWFTLLCICIVKRAARAFPHFVAAQSSSYMSHHFYAANGNIEISWDFYMF